MKKLFMFLAIPGLIAFTSCGGEEGGDGKESDGKTTQADANDFSGMEDVDLTEHELPVTVKVPQIDVGGAILPYEIIHEEGDFRWVISIGEGGDKYRLMFEIAEGLDDNPIANKKSSFEDFQSVEYLLEDDNTLMYKVTYEDDQIDPQFHVFGTATIDGMLFKLYSDPTVTFRERHAERMLKSIKSVQTAGSDEEQA